MFTPVESCIGALILCQATTTLLLNNGRTLGASSILAGSLFSPNLDNLPVMFGIGLSAAAVSRFVPWLLLDSNHVVEILGNWRRIVAGLMVGAGTKYCNGCTSGHLLCGASLGSIRSLVASATFFLTAVITARFTFASYPSPCTGPCYTPTYPSQERLTTLLSILGATTLASLSTCLLPRSTPGLSKTIVNLLSGFIFGLGLIVAGMTNPAKPLGFLMILLDGGKRWDPSLAMLVLFAMAPNFLIWRSALGRMEKPLLECEWRLPSRRDINLRLVAGSMLFGVGWAIQGVCPGAGIVTGFVGGWKGAVWVVGFWVGYGYL